MVNPSSRKALLWGGSAVTLQQGLKNPDSNFSNVQAHDERSAPLMWKARMLRMSTLSRRAARVKTIPTYLSFLTKPRRYIVLCQYNIFVTQCQLIVKVCLRSVLSRPERRERPRYLITAVSSFEILLPRQLGIRMTFWYYVRITIICNTEP